MQMKLGLLAIPIAVAILAFLLVRRRARRHDQSVGGTCGQCGYSTRGLNTFICPECGSDLREVGIYVPAAYRGDRKAPPSLSGKVTRWSIAIAVVGVVISFLIHNYCLPTVYSGFQTYGLVGPPSRQYTQVVFQSHGYHLDWPYRQPQRSLILDTLDVTLITNDSHTIAMQVTIDQLGYQYTRADGTRVLETRGLDKSVVLDWMRSADIDVNNPHVATEAGEIVQVAKDAVHLGMNSPRQSVFAGRTGGSSATYASPPRIATPITVFFWIGVWLVGVRRISRSHKDPHARSSTT